nr:phosphoglycerate mutase family protein [uncultured Acetatifactor sp.]
MRAIVMRHGKVDFQWKKWSTSEQFNKDCQMYDEAPIYLLLSNDIRINYQDIYISTLQRSRDTAKQLFGERDFISTKLLDEVPLCASVISNKKLPLIFWNISARLQWLFHIHSQKEGRKETVYRAEQFINMIAEKGKDCIIVTHGFFLHTLLSQMKQHAFKLSHTKLSYSNGEFVIAER